MKTRVALVSLLALGLASQTAYADVQRDLHSRVWQKLTLATNAAGLVGANVHSYTELRNGLCRFENGALLDSGARRDTARWLTLARFQPARRHKSTGNFKK